MRYAAIRLRFAPENVGPPLPHAGGGELGACQRSSESEAGAARPMQRKKPAYADAAAARPEAGAARAMRGEGATDAYAQTDGARLCCDVVEWIQRELTLAPRSRGFHLVTGEVEAALPELRGLAVGLLHVMIRHTSASLTVNENASADVRSDFETWANEAVPEGAPYWSHTLEGADDMPAHVKAALFGASLTLPIARGRLMLGTWQGIYLCEHRDHGGPRSLIATAWGERS